MLLRLIATLPKARKWVRQTVDQHSADALPLGSLPSGKLRGVVTGEQIAGVRVAIVQTTPRPPLEAWGLHAADDFNFFGASGIALGDMIFVRRGEEHDESLLLHELVHVLQWRRLGVSRFLALYSVLLLERGYADHPLEAMAYDLQRRFDDGDLSFDLAAVAGRRTDEIAAHFARQSGKHKFAMAALRWL